MAQTQRESSWLLRCYASIVMTSPYLLRSFVSAMSYLFAASIREIGNTLGGWCTED